jgi:hypothetical protein
MKNYFTKRKFGSFSRFCFMLSIVLFLQGVYIKANAQTAVPDKLSVTLNQNWRFRADSGNEGMIEGWYEKDFNDAAWSMLKSGTPWEKQGITHQGWGWYRQKISIPAEYAGMPLTLKLGTTASDDDAFVNGVRIGGFKSEYKYVNMQDRVYTIPSSVLRYGEENTIAVRAWGGNLTFIGKVSGLASGTFAAEIDPYSTLVAYTDNTTNLQHINLFDFTDTQRGKTFNFIFRYAKETIDNGAVKLEYTFKDFQSNSIKTGNTTAITLNADGTAHAVVSIDSATAQILYLRGRFVANLKLRIASGQVLDEKNTNYDYLSFAKRDTLSLPALIEQWDATPYGNLKLVDEIDCSTSLFHEEHAYLQSNYTTKAQWHNTPGAPTTVNVNNILGKKAREAENGWFAYKIGRGKLKPRATYLLRIEYPEDKPRYCPIEVQAGQNFFDAGWRSGVNIADDPYDNWPLSKSWQYYDVIVPLDDETAGAGGTGSASAETGFWVYFPNKLNGTYFSMYKGGTAVASIKLYEIDPDTNAPVINKPSAGLPQRILMFDWERQADHEPADLVKYAKLMGYNAISPVILKWTLNNYSKPLAGYNSYNVDDQNYWTRKDYYNYETGINGEEAVPGKKTVYDRYMEATKGSGLYFIPRIEYGASSNLDSDAYAKTIDGVTGVVPNRHGLPWCANLLNPEIFNDMKLLLDHLYKPYVNDNPQLAGMMWRMRYDRLPISYGKKDIAMYNAETGSSIAFPIPNTNSIKKEYANWWHQKRRDFHVRILNQIKSYRSDLKLYYYNWDNDKFSIVLPDLNSASFHNGVSYSKYLNDREIRKGTTTSEYLQIMESGNFGESLGKNSPDYGLRPYLYSEVSGMELLAPANILHLAGDSAYLNYFKTADGVSVSNCVSYDEIHSRSLNPKYECNVITPGGSAYSMAFELLNYFHADARTLTYTVYTYGRGFADAHRRFAQAFLALPAIKGNVIDNPDEDVKIRAYNADNESYIGVASKAYEAKTITVKLPVADGAENITVKDLVTGEMLTTSIVDGELQFVVNSEPMQLNSFLKNATITASNNTNKVTPSVTLFPNPVNEMLNIKIGSQLSENVEISIIDSFGKEVLKNTFGTSPTISMSVAGLPKGVYVCRIASTQHISSVKFIK